MKKKVVLWVTVIIFVIICILICVYARSIYKYELVTVEENQISIRMPGESNEPIDVLYNKEFVEQQNSSSILTLKFNKEGYYYVKIIDERYVFHYVSNEKNDYVIDLLDLEYKNINKINAQERMKEEISVLIFGVIIIGAIFICWAIIKKVLGSNKS